MELRTRLEMAGNSLLTLLDPEKDLMPTGGYEVAHDLGRWWDAVLRLEETIDFVIPAVPRPSDTSSPTWSKGLVPM